MNSPVNSSLSRRAAAVVPTSLRRPVALAVLSGLVVLGCGAESEIRSGLEEVRHPDLEPIEGELRSRLEGARQHLDRLFREPESSPRELAAAFGELGERYHAAGLLQAAEGCYGNAARLAPQEPSWPALAGLLQLRGGRLAAAVESFERSLSLKSDQGVLRLHLGEALLGLGRTADAAEAYEGALVEGEESLRAAALYGLGRAAADTGEDELAIERFSEVLALQPEAGTARYALAQASRRAGETERAQRLLQQGSRGTVTFPDPLAERIAARATGPGATLRRANQRLMAGDLAAAEKLFREVLGAVPDDLAARRNLAITLQRQGRAGEAVTVLEQAPPQLAFDPQLLLDLATARLGAGSAEEAVRDFRRVIEAAPDLVAARFGLANALMSLGRSAQAQPELERILELEPAHARARYQLAMSLYQQGERETGRGRLLGLIAELPAFAPARLSLASILLESGDVRGAEEQYLAVLEHGSQVAQKATASAQLGLLAQRRNDPVAARGHLEQAVALNPGESSAALALSGLLIRDGGFVAASATLERALAASGASPQLTPQLRGALARLLATAPEESVRDGERALELAQSAYTARRSIDHAETVAMAMAEGGDFVAAADWQRGLVEQARSMGRGDLVQRLGVNLRLYEAGRPVRMRTN